MRVGRDHIASTGYTGYTLAFAYVGTALPMLMLAALTDGSNLETSCPAMSPRRSCAATGRKATQRRATIRLPGSCPGQPLGR
ncbi:YibE/F family protein [Georgenia thermotolerans]|uniref:YibE/F family protein n=1 Tax=Georgenia thermotolerans TaxID=527326 RepID=UPI0029CA9223|nr:hypothetical protein [Georgenia thermotolerans]